MKPAAAQPTRTVAQNRQMHGLAARLTAFCSAIPEDIIPARTRKELEAIGGKAEDIGHKWLRVACKSVSGQTSSSALTVAQAREVCELLEAAIADLQRRLSGMPAPRDEATITPKQQGHLEKLIGACTRLDGRWSDMAGDRARMREWCQHYLKRPWPQTQTDADTAIEAFKSILTRSLPPAEQLQRELLELKDDFRLTPFGAALVGDGLKRSRKWGPYQWSKLHEIWTQIHGGGHV